jgi:hypothetical protein
VFACEIGRSKEKNNWEDFAPSTKMDAQPTTKKVGGFIGNGWIDMVGEGGGWRDRQSPVYH